MKKTMIIALAVGFALAGGATARAQTAAAAQTPTAFVDVNIGYEGKPSALATSSTFPLFGETGAAATSLQPGSSGVLDARIGMRVGRQFGVGLAVSGGRSEADGLATASLPSPLRFNSPTTINLDAPGLKRREVFYHLQAMWFLPLSEKTSLSIFGGPSVTHLQQNVPQVSVSAATQSASVLSANESASALGGNAGVDVTTMFTRRFGAGAFVRYVGGRVDLPSAADVKVGGVQGGAGLRLRF